MKTLKKLISIFTFSYVISIHADETTIRCTYYDDQIGYITPGYFCCINRYDKEKCEKRNILGDTIYLSPPLVGSDLVNWKRRVSILDSLRISDSIQIITTSKIRDKEKQTEIKQYRKSKKWSKRVWNAIELGSVFIGMTKAQAIESWGKPDDINTTISRSGRSEQWVYGSESYLYFQDGILTAIQN